MTKRLSTPIRCYVIIVVCTILLFLLACISPMNWSSLFKNVGYSLIASIIAAILIDLGTTKTQKLKQKEQYDVLTANCRRRCRALLDSVVEAANVSGDKYDDDMFDFSTWGQKALAPYTEEMTEEDYLKALTEVEYTIIRIRDSAVQLHELSINFLDNENFSKQFRYALNCLASLCSTIERAFDEDNIDQVSNTVSMKLPKAIIRTFPELADEFTHAYPVLDQDDEEEG